MGATGKRADGPSGSEPATDPAPGPWRVVAPVTEIHTRWISLIGERLVDDAGTELEYWRVVKADSLVLVTIQSGRLLLPRRAYRPGVGRRTLDLAGGRLEDPAAIGATACAILRREFGLDAEPRLESLATLPGGPFDVDSSSSSQRLHAAVAELAPEVAVAESAVGAAYPATPAGARQLLGELACAQCRLVVREWLASTQPPAADPAGAAQRS